MPKRRILKNNLKKTPEYITVNLRIQRHRQNSKPENKTADDIQRKKTQIDVTYFNNSGYR